MKTVLKCKFRTMINWIKWNDNFYSVLFCSVVRWKCLFACYSIYYRYACIFGVSFYHDVFSKPCIFNTKISFIELLLLLLLLPWKKTDVFFENSSRKTTLKNIYSYNKKNPHQFSQGACEWINYGVILKINGL